MKNSSNNSFVQEVKLSEGVYFSDYRSHVPMQSNNCLNSALNHQ